MLTTQPPGTQDASAPDPHEDRAQASDIAKALVAIYKEQFGRGPTKVRVTWTDADTIVCVLEDTFTAAERKLVRLGKHESVRMMRVTLQYATVEEFCSTIEAVTGRKVRAFHSSIDTLAGGQALEVFVLHPAGFDGEGRLDLGQTVDEFQ